MRIVHKPENVANVVKHRIEELSKIGNESAKN